MIGDDRDGIVELLDATANADAIAEWAQRDNSSNIAIACGKSRLMVVDLDPRHGCWERLAVLHDGVHPEEFMGIVASVAWIIDGYMESKNSLLIQNAVLLLINMLGVWRWLPRAEKEAKA